MPMAKPGKVLIIVMMLSGLFAATPAVSAGSSTAVVTNDGDSGEGTFRAAVEAANADSGITRIKFDEEFTISLESKVVFTGSQDLRIVGDSSTISGAGIANDATFDSGLFAATGGGRSLTIKDLNVSDSPNNGIGVILPENLGGSVHVRLVDVTVTDAQFHGVHVDGQSTTGFNTDDVLQDGCSDPNPFDSNANIDVTLKDVTISGAGDLDPSFDLSIETGCPQDFDGLRVDQGGNDSLTADIVDSAFHGNLADGAELDETGDGSVNARVVGSSFTGNGDTVTILYTEDRVLKEAIDLDDGFDIDEAGAGSLIAMVRDSDASGNFDEGLDFDEAGAGDADVKVVDVTAIGNTDEGVKVDEEDGGSLFFVMRDTTVSGTLDNDAVQLGEIGDGSVDALISDSTITDNDGDGAKIEESGAGNLNVVVRKATVTGNSDGFQFVESEEGDEPTNGSLTALIRKSTITGNSSAGVQAEQTAPGSGTLTIEKSDLSGNGDGETDLDGVVLG